MKKTILVGITSGIAAYKTITLIEALKQEHCEIFVIMTKNAAKMIPVEAVEEASENKVFIELFENNFDYQEILQKRTVDHITLADKADLMIIVPATANSIAKLAHGIADDFLTTTALAMTKPILLCPAMNVHMWNNPITQENLRILQTHGYYLIEPVIGKLACGYEGIGRLGEIACIKNEVLEQLAIATSLQGKKVLITAGGTMEKIDAVRYITNRSSGKMGIALAEECYRRGADVLLFRAKNAVKPRYMIQEKTFSTAEELLQLVEAYAKEYHYVYHAAAVGDFVVANAYTGKLSSEKAITLTLQPQIKIVNQIKKINPNIKLIAFKAESKLTEAALLQKAQEKLQTSNADVVVANDISKSDRGFESDMNEVFILFPAGKRIKLPYATKKEIAKQIVDLTL